MDSATKQNPHFLLNETTASFSVSFSKRKAKRNRLVVILPRDATKRDFSVGTKRALVYSLLHRGVLNEYVSSPFSAPFTVFFPAANQRIPNPLLPRTCSQIDSPAPFFPFFPCVASRACAREGTMSACQLNTVPCGRLKCKTTQQC
jgi:hypothetical protein